MKLKYAFLSATTCILLGAGLTIALVNEFLNIDLIETAKKRIAPPIQTYFYVNDISSLLKVSDVELNEINGDLYAEHSFSFKLTNNTPHSVKSFRLVAKAYRPELSTSVSTEDFSNYDIPNVLAPGESKVIGFRGTSIVPLSLINNDLVANSLTYWAAVSSFTNELGHTYSYKKK